MKKNQFLFICLLTAGLILPGAGFAADLTIPELELISRGYWQQDRLILSTRGRTELQVSGGYKFGGSLLLGFESENLGYAGRDAPVLDDYAPDESAYIS